MENENSKAYSEVIEILKLIDDEEKLEKLPIDMLEVLKSKADANYHPTISKDIPLENQNLQNETMRILAWISMKYWNDVIEEESAEENNTLNVETTNSNEENIVKENGKEILEKNIANSGMDVNYSENNIEENITNKIEINDAFNNDKISQESSNLPISFKELKWYEKIKIKIIEFFNKLFKTKKKENETNI